VEGFDGELYAHLRGVRRKLGDALLHHAPGRFEIPLRRRSADEDEHIGPKGGGLLYGAVVVFETGTPLGCVDGGEHAAPAEAGDSQPRVPHDACALGQPCLRNLIAPQPDKTDIGSGTALRGLPHAPFVRGLLVEAQA